MPLPDPSDVYEREARKRRQSQRQERAAYYRGRIARDLTARTKIGRASGGLPGYINPETRRNKNYVQSIQRELRSLGFNIAVDGIWGPQTQRAYNAASSPAVGLPEDDIRARVPYASVVRVQEQYRSRIKAEEKRVREEYQQLQARLRQESNELSRQIQEAEFWRTNAYRQGSLMNAASRFRSRNLEMLRERQSRLQRETREQDLPWWRDTLNAVGNALGFLQEVAVQRPYYASQLLQNRAIARGEQPSPFRNQAGLALNVALELTTDEDSVFSEVDSPEERERLREAGELESFGERTYRSISEMAIQASAWLGVDAAEDRLAGRGEVESFRDLGAEAPGVVSGTIDLAFQVFADPLNLIPGAGLLGKLDSPIKAARLGASNPQAMNSILDAAARAAETAASRSDGGRYLQALMPSLKPKQSAGLVGALTTDNSDAFLRYLTDPKDGFIATWGGKAEDFKRAGLSDAAAQQAAQLGQQATTDALRLAENVRRAGQVTQAHRRQLLELSLGRTWTPQVGFGQRAAYRGLARAGDSGIAARALAAMPAATRLAKTDSMRFALGRRLRGGDGGAFLGRRVRSDPSEGLLTRHAGLSTGEKGAARAFYAELKKLDPFERVQGAREFINSLPETSITRVLSERLERLAQHIPDPADYARFQQLQELARVPRSTWRRRQSRVANSYRQQLGIPQLRRDIVRLRNQIEKLQRAGSDVPEDLTALLDTARERLGQLENRLNDTMRDWAARNRYDPGRLPPELRQEYLDLLARDQAGTLRPSKTLPRDLANQLRRLSTDLARIASAPPEYFERLRRNYEAELRDWAARGGAKLQPRWSRWHQGWISLTRGFNTIPTASVNMHLPAERAEAMRDWVIGMGGTNREADDVFSKMLEPNPVDEVIKTAKGVQEDMIDVLLQRGGLKPEEIAVFRQELASNPTRFFRENRSWYSVLDDLSRGRNPFKNERVYDVDGAKSPVVLSQSQYTLPLVDPQDVRRFVRQLRAERAGFAGALEVPALWAGYLADKYYQLHRAWKTVALVGAPVRYILRVHMDERLRMFMAHGWAGLHLPRPGLQRKLNSKMLDENFGLRNASHFDEVGIQGVPEHLLDFRGIEVNGHQVLKPSDPEFVPNAWNIVSRQVSPENDQIQNLLMPHLHTGDDAALLEAKNSAKEWLTTTPDGRVYLERAINLNPFNRSLNSLLDNAQKWLEDILPNREVVEARLNGPFSLSTYRANTDWHPKQAWGETFTRLYRPDRRDPKPHWVQLARRFVLASPTTNLSRNPFYYREFNRQWEALVSSGMDPRRASIEASRRAVRRTNSVLFDANQKTRFAAKTDLFSPFAQAREEQVRVWTQLVRENPARAAKLFNTVALAFNNGVDHEIIYQDRYGNWGMRVPGSPALSRALARWWPTWLPLRDAISRQLVEGYEFRLKNLLFVQDAWSTLPRPGGPWWSAAGSWLLSDEGRVAALPDNDLLKEFMFPFGEPQLLFPRKEAAFFWMAITDSTVVPWEPSSWIPSSGPERQNYFERQKNRAGQLVFAELMVQAAEEGRDPSTITMEEVKEGVRARLAGAAAMGMVWPAPVQPLMLHEEEFREVQDQYRRPDGSIDYVALQNGNPEFLGYSLKGLGETDPIRDTYTDEQGNVNIDALRENHPAYYRRWFERQEEDYNERSEMRRFKDQLLLPENYMDVGEFMEMVAEKRAIDEAFQESQAILNDPNLKPAQKILEMDEWRERHRGDGEAFGLQLDNYARDQALGVVMRSYGDDREEALRAWQYRYDVSNRKRDQLIKEGDWRHDNLWLEARPTRDLLRLFEVDNEQGYSAEVFAERRMSPAEAVNFLRVYASMQADVDDYQRFNAAANRISNANEDLLYNQGKGKTYIDVRAAAAEWWREKKSDAYDEIGRKFDEIGRISDQMEALAESNIAKTERAKAAGTWDNTVDWPTYYRLKDHRSRLYAEVKGIKDALYESFPELNTLEDEVRYMHLVNSPEWEHLSDARRAELAGERMGWRKSPEQEAYDNMPTHIQRDYVGQLVEQLTLDDYGLRQQGLSRMQWDWLTDYQKELVEGHVADDQLDLIKRLSAQAAEQAGGGGGRRGGGRTFGGLEIGEGGGLLAFAVELFERYNKRGDLPEPTVELAEFKALGDNKLARAAYLKSHPALQEWFRLGPMAQMPPALATTVRYIMVNRLGRWNADGTAPESWDEATEIGFAMHMLEKYNNRHGERPDAYQRWVEMPTGVDRNRYFQQHPEIAEWLGNGPMARMPETYQEVVRDIMRKYGQWTKRNDPLSVLLDQYFSTPSYAKQDFLEAHPEILAYWRAVRSPEERRIFDMAQTYFSLPDDAKRAYIEAHPEVQEYFIQQRRRNYQRFLERVAVYLGSMPELAEEYMENQTEFIRQLMEKYGQRLLVAEAVTVGPRREATGRLPLRANRRRAT